MFACDIALLFLKKPIQFSKKVKKALLPNTSEWMRAGANHFHAIGWGWTSVSQSFISNSIVINNVFCGYISSLVLIICWIIQETHFYELTRVWVCWQCLQQQQQQRWQIFFKAGCSCSKMEENENDQIILIKLVHHFNSPEIDLRRSDLRRSNYDDLKQD